MTLQSAQQLLINNRLKNNLITGTLDLSPEQVVDRLLGVQAQYNGPALINLYNRVPGAEPTNFQHQLEAAPIVKAWGNRQTLHFFTEHRWQMYVQLFANKQTWAPKHLREHHFEPDTVFNEFFDYLDRHQQFTRDDLVVEFGKNAETFLSWSALLLHASLRGRLYLPNLDSQNTVYHSAQITENRSFSQVLQDYYLAYFTAYGPATMKDFLHFVGFSKQYLGSAIDDLPPLNVTELGDETYYSVAPLDPNIDVPEIVLLSKFDPLLVGYHDKTWLTIDETKRVWAKAGQIEPVILIDGQFWGTWRYQMSGTKLNITIWCAKIINQRRQRLIKRKLTEYAQLFNRELGTVTYSGKRYGLN